MTKRNSADDNESPLRRWIDENKTLANLLAAWLLFVFSVAIAKLMGNFDVIPIDFIGAVEKYPFMQYLIVPLPLALLSLFNVYGIPAFVNWFKSNRRHAATRLIAFGSVFGSFFCCPMFGFAIGSSVAIFIAVTIVHTFVRLNKGIK
jgi:hypothetical protein